MSENKALKDLRAELAQAETAADLKAARDELNKHIRAAQREEQRAAQQRFEQKQLALAKALCEKYGATTEQEVEQLKQRLLSTAAGAAQQHSQARHGGGQYGHR